MHLEACGVETSAIDDWQAHTERSLEFHSKNAEMLKRRWSEAPGRNDPCPCGSGKKFKKCCGK